MVSRSWMPSPRNRVDLVLIGVHADSHVGQEAIDLVLGMHPSTVVVVVGSAGDIDVLAPAYVRGARGMLLWETPAPPWYRSDESVTGRRAAVHSDVLGGFHVRGPVRFSADPGTLIRSAVPPGRRRRPVPAGAG